MLGVLRHEIPHRLPVRVYTLTIGLAVAIFVVGVLVWNRGTRTINDLSAWQSVI